MASHNIIEARAHSSTYICVIHADGDGRRVPSWRLCRHVPWLQGVWREELRGGVGHLPAKVASGIRVSVKRDPRTSPQERKPAFIWRAFQRSGREQKHGVYSGLGLRFIFNCDEVHCGHGRRRRDMSLTTIWKSRKLGGSDHTRSLW